MRCSWINKYLFLESLCTSTTGCYVLENVLKSIESIISKDVEESLTTDYTEFSYDRIPKDDNRCFSCDVLNALVQEDFIWFSKLTPDRQVSAILKLLKISGGGLLYMLCKSLLSVYNKRKRENRVVLSEYEDRENASSNRKSSKNENNTEEETGTIENDGESDGVINEYTKKKLMQLSKRENNLKKYKKSKGIISSSEGKIKKNDGVSEVVDYLQIMPIYLNRRIMCHVVDEKLLTNLKKVGKYWVKMIDDSINEKSGRRAINAKINKIIATNQEYLIGKGDKGNDGGSGDGGNNGGGDDGGTTQDDDNEEFLKSFKELGIKGFLRINNLSEVRN